MSQRKLKKSAIQVLHIDVEQELDILQRILEITNSEMELDKVLNEVVKVVTDFTEADSVFIYLYDEQKKFLNLMASKTPHQQEVGVVHLEVGEGITGWVAQENKTVSISQNAYQDKRFKSFDVLPEDRYEAFLSIPLIYRNTVIGVINVQHQSPYEHTDSMKGILTLISKQVGGVIIHAQLYEAARIKALQFDSLNKVSASITSPEYIDEILNLIVIVSARMFNSKICSIMLVNSKGMELELKATHSLSDAFKNRSNLLIKGSLMGDVVTKKQPLAIFDVKQEERYKLRDMAIKEDLSSLLSVPMVVKDKVMGVLSVYTQEPYSFTKEDISVMQIVANQAAVAVENTKLIEEAGKAKEALETRKVVERAKGILMDMRQINEQSAYRLIHKKSMDSCKSMKEIAESIILMDELQKS